MSRDKQTEIANDLNMHCVSLSEQFCGEMSCNACISNWLYNAGYVKASDLAEEIFAEIEKMLLDNHIGHYKTTIDTWCYNFNNEIISEIAELKNKYTEEGK